MGLWIQCWGLAKYLCKWGTLKPELQNKDYIMCCAKSLQSCRTLSTMDCSTAGPSVHRVLQARILKWIALPSSSGSSRIGRWVPYRQRHLGSTEDYHMSLYLPTSLLPDSEFLGTGTLSVIYLSTGIYLSTVWYHTKTLLWIDSIVIHCLWEGKMM